MTLAAFRDNVNNGETICENQTGEAYAAGIVGGVSSGDFILKDSTTTGNVYAASSVTTKVHTGGAIGYFASNNISCELNNIAISGTFSAAAENAYKGSVLGYFGYNITGCL